MLAATQKKNNLACGYTYVNHCPQSNQHISFVLVSHIQFLHSEQPGFLFASSISSVHLCTRARVQEHSYDVIFQIRGSAEGGEASSSV